MPTAPAHLPTAKAAKRNPRWRAGLGEEGVEGVDVGNGKSCGFVHTAFPLGPAGPGNTASRSPKPGLLIFFFSLSSTHQAGWSNLLFSRVTCETTYYVLGITQDRHGSRQVGEGG